MLLPSWRVFEAVLNTQGRLYFVCIAHTKDLEGSDAIAESDRQAALTGKIFVIIERGRWQSIVRPKLHNAFEFLNEYQAGSGASIDQHFAARESELLLLCQANCAFQTRFQLKRNGVVDFWIDDGELRSPEAPTLPEDETVIMQVYTFLRDVGHKHQHHAPATDMIVTLHNVMDGDDVKWRLRTLYGIYRRIIGFKRQDDIAVQIRSVGLLAYAQAFKNVWKEDRVDAEKEFPKFYDDAMKQSIQASETRMRLMAQQQSDVWSILRTLSIAMLGLVASLAGLIRISSSTEIATPAAPFLVNLASLLLTYPEYAIVLSVLITLLLIALTTRRIKPHQWRIYRYLQTLTQAYKRKVAVGMYAMLSLLCLLAAYGIARV